MAVVFGCLVLVGVAAGAAVSVMRTSQLVEQSHGEDDIGAPAASAVPRRAGSGPRRRSRRSRHSRQSSHSRSRGGQRRKRHPGKSRRSNTPRVIEAKADDTSMTASTMSLKDDVPVTVVLDTGDKFTAL